MTRDIDADVSANRFCTKFAEVVLDTVVTRTKLNLAKAVIRRDANRRSTNFANSVLAIDE